MRNGYAVKIINKRWNNYTKKWEMTEPTFVVSGNVSDFSALLLSKNQDDAHNWQYTMGAVAFMKQVFPRSAIDNGLVQVVKLN